MKTLLMEIYARMYRAFGPQHWWPGDTQLEIAVGAILTQDTAWGKVEKAPREFEIDMLRCIFCGFCQEVCPEEAIFLMEDYSLTGGSRQEMIYNKEKVLELGGTHHDTVMKWKHK